MHPAAGPPVVPKHGVALPPPPPSAMSLTGPSQPPPPVPAVAATKFAPMQPGMSSMMVPVGVPPGGFALAMNPPQVPGRRGITGSIFASVTTLLFSTSASQVCFGF